MFEAKGLRKVFRPKRRGEVVAVDGVSFSIEPGHTFGFLGPNGAGKTTTIRLVAGLLKPTDGTITFDGSDIRQDPHKVRQATGLLTESGGTYDRLKCGEYLRFFGRLYGLNPQDSSRHIDELLGRFELTDSRSKLVGTFSKGMKQKLSIARALLHRPRLLLLDEPTSGLDPAVTETLWTLLSDLKAEQSVITILCTHNLDEAERLCDRVAIITDGRIVKEGRPGRLGSERDRTIRIVIKAPDTDAIRAVRETPGVGTVDEERIEEGYLLRVKTHQPASEINPLVARAVVDSGAELISLSEEAESLKDVYLRLTRGGE